MKLFSLFFVVKLATCFYPIPDKLIKNGIDEAAKEYKDAEKRVQVHYKLQLSEMMNNTDKNMDEFFGYIEKKSKKYVDKYDQYMQVEFEVGKVSFS